MCSSQCTDPCVHSDWDQMGRMWHADMARRAGIQREPGGMAGSIGVGLLSAHSPHGA